MRTGTDMLQFGTNTKKVRYQCSLKRILYQLYNTKLFIIVFKFLLKFNKLKILEENQF
ncbi:hypothetical protein Hdeb2414_s0087g00785771 [Helianthus debilis subsp. tardiflorus]